VVCTGRIGDVLFATPVVRSIKSVYPDAAIDLLVFEGTHDVIAASPDIRRIWTIAGRMLDHPNERSLHQQPVPRTGGIGVAAGLAVNVPLVSPIEWWPLWLGAALLVGVSFLEDLAGLSILGRLAAHFLAAGALPIGLFAQGLECGWAAVVILPVGWKINFYNFMDSIDGLAGGMAVFGFGFLAVLFWVRHHQPMMLVNAAIAAAATFLPFNFHPARIFLRDAGSTILGFLAVGLGLTGWHYGVWSLWVPLLVFSPFIADASWP
jgi:UDP-GlcNAc:undecaprenyl-phosphate GlcNAc-1-phosphate transferase